MPRQCTVCRHPDRAAIDAALVAGDSLRYIAERFDLSVYSLHRHKAAHLPQALALAHGAQETAHGDDLLAQLRDLQARTLAVLERAETAGDAGTTLKAVGEARRNLELLAKLLGELQQAGTVNVILSPEWVQVRAVVIGALSGYPEARLAVAEALTHAGA